jgi:hypothetical protein
MRSDRRRIVRVLTPHSTALVGQPVHVRYGHLPSRVHLRRGFRLRGRLVRFASHRRKGARS